MSFNIAFIYSQSCIVIYDRKIIKISLFVFFEIHTQNNIVAEHRYKLMALLNKNNNLNILFYEI